MSARGVGVTELVAGSVPDALVAVLVVLTALGSTYVVTSAGPFAYLFGERLGLLDRRDGARLLAVTIGGLALVVLLKGAFAEPRPPESVMRIAEDGNGFPSGHATGATVFYSGLAALLAVGSRPRRYLVGAGLIVLVSFTRVALGVHYLVDVLAGMTAGTAFVGLALAATRRRVVYGFLLAVALAVAAVVVAGPTVDAVAALGGTSGALAGWLLVTERERVTEAVRPVASTGVVLAVGGAAAATLAVEAAAAAVFATHVAAGTVFVGLPAVQNFSR
ncbi:phosphatase PAP2 family protein [Halobacterium jilantaiense]|uniref:PAP2 superfamily protein n=1 Tax=Halobacterium jilantaiense TaxID=355548 RepID=A0A1I0Q2B5_9EURY|nr:phosphatase PAP2 family protein [Halobacterium jilantaiense]SEW21056.1 PAP2 superfamily protein [Halobacterium jilantaiense]